MAKEKGIKKRITGLAMAGAMLVTTVFSNTYIANAADTLSGENQENVLLTIGKEPQVEVALAVGNTTVDYGNFENDLKNALVAKGVKEENFSYLKVDANDSKLSNSFKWWTYDHTTKTGKRVVDETNHKYIEKNANYCYNSYYNPPTNNFDYLESHIVSDDDGTTMTFKGYGVNGYKDFKFLPNNQATKKEIEFCLKEPKAVNVNESYDALDGFGFLINSSIKGDYDSNQLLNGYLVFMKYDGQGLAQGVYLYKLTNVNTKTLHCETSANISAISGVRQIAYTSSYSSTQYYKKVKLEVLPTYVKMWYVGGTDDKVFNSQIAENNTTNLVSWNYNGSSVTEVPLVNDQQEGEDFKGGYGPLASYNSHECPKETAVTLSNLSMKAEYVKSLTEVVRDPNWDADKTSFIINLNEAKIDDFSSVYTTGEIINRLNDDNLTYIGWCSDTNKAASQVFVDGIANGSALVSVNDGTYQQQVEKIADAIIAKLNRDASSDDVNTFLTNEKFSFSTSGAVLDDGNWSVGYSEKGFENAKDNISTYQNLNNASFEKTGYYEIYYDGNTKAVKSRIRIHEKPSAVFTAQIVDDKIVVNNKSFDTEFCTEPSEATGSKKDGIATCKFEYRNLSATNPIWTTDEPNTVSEGETYLVRLTVKDADGAESMAVLQISKTAASVVPYGSFKITSNTYIKGIDTSVTIIDQSYMPDGSTDFTTTYQLKKDGTNIGSSFSISPSGSYNYSLDSLAEGNYSISMTAQNDSNKSATVSRNFRVVQGYAINYDADGEDGAPTTQYKIKDTNLILSSIAPSKAGYTFQGWQADNSAKKYKPGEVYSSNEGCTLKAIWAKNMSYEASDVYKVYDTNEYTIEVSVTDPEDGYTIKYGTSADTCTADSLTYSKPGRYKIFFTITKDGYQTVTNSRILEISKVDLTSALLNDKNVCYTGNVYEINPVVLIGIENGAAPQGIAEYTYYTNELCTILTTSEDGAAGDGKAPSKAGTYYVKAVVAADEYYYGKTSNVAKLVIDNVMEEVEDIPNPDVITGDDEDDIKSALDKINDLLAPENVDNLTTEQKEELEQKKQELEKLIEKLEEVKDEILKSGNDFDKLPQTENINTNNEEDINTQLDKINEILEEESDHLTSEQKDALETLKEKLEKLKEKVEEVKSKLNNEDGIFNGLPSIESLKISDKDRLLNEKEAIKKLLEDYGDNLTDTQKSELESKIRSLDERLEKVKELEKELEAVDSKIKDIPEVKDVFADDKGEISTLLEKVNELLENPDNLTEEQIAQLEETKQSLNDKITFINAVGDPTIVEAKVEKKDDVVASVEIDSLNNIIKTEVLRGNETAVNALINGGKINIVMNITANNESTSDIDMAIKNDGKKTYKVFDVNINMNVFDSQNNVHVYKISDTIELIEFSFELSKDAVGKKNYQLYRSHLEPGAAKETVQKIKRLTKDEFLAKTSEGFYVEGNRVYILSHKFSTYAIAYDDTEKAPKTGDSNNSGFMLSLMALSLGLLSLVCLIKRKKEV